MATLQNIENVQKVIVLERIRWVELQSAGKWVILSSINLLSGNRVGRESKCNGHNLSTL